MARVLRKFITFLVLFALVGVPVRGTLAQSNADANAAEQAATAILQLAVDRQFNAMYDHIHPDAKEVVPRAAAVNAFTVIYEQAQVGDATITGVKMGPWTWGVTGKEYPNAAAIAFTQPYVDSNTNKAAILNDTMYLVEADGEWRWFFGSDKASVQSMIEQYGQADAKVGTSKPLTDGDFLQNVVNDLDTFYDDVLSYTDVTYKSPGVVVVSPGDQVMTACGPASSGFWGFYCPPDATLYLEESLLGQLQQSGDFAAAFVIAHEWAHHIQTLLGFERTERPDSWNQVHSIELELMADCMAGAWAQDVDTRGMLQPGDIDEAISFTIERLGDPAYVNEYDPQAHGSADQRVTSFKNGYTDGFSGCNVTM